jgi:hypothetical protein
MHKFMRTILVTAAALAVASSAALAQNKAPKDKEAALRSQPGYVDFSMLDKLDQPAKVEVNLRDPMLNLVGKFISEDDPELKDLISSLKLVRVRVYQITRSNIDQLMAIGSETATMLDKAGWERIVRVRDEEEGEYVDVYFKPSSNAEWIDGVLVVALGDDDDAAFVNIVGTIRPEDVARIGEQLDIDGMDKVRIKKRVRN